MSRMLSARMLTLVALACLALIPVARAQSPRLTVSVHIDYPTCLKSEIPVEVIIDHPLDSIAGFELWLKIDTTVPARFKLASEGNIAYSLTGLPTAVYQFFSVRTLRGDASDVQIVGLADDDIVPPYRRGFAPGTHTVIRLAVQLQGGADTLPQPMAAIEIDQTPEHFGFSDPEGHAIGITGGQIDTSLVHFVPDSLFANFNGCAAMSDLNGDNLSLSFADLILLQAMVQGKVAVKDSLFQADFNGDCRVDSADVTMFENYFQHGLSALMPYPRPTCCYQTLVPCCEGTVGNINCDLNQNVDISDLTTMIQNMFVLIDEPCCFGEADIDRSGGVDISDLTALIESLFISLSPLPNCPLVGSGPLVSGTCGQ